MPMRRDLIRQRFSSQNRGQKRRGGPIIVHYFFFQLPQPLKPPLCSEKETWRKKKNSDERTRSPSPPPSLYPFPPFPAPLRLHTMSLSEREKESIFQDRLRSLGLQMTLALPDGNCLFRAVADQMYGDQSFHDIVRDACMNWMSRERQHYTEFITGDFERYIAHRRQDRVYGSHLEIQAVSELYGRKVEVYDVDEFVSNPRARPRNVFQGEYRGHPIRLSYHNGNHYNSITDPDDPHIGEGLLPGFKSREEIERDLIQRVKESTDRDAIEDEISRVAEKQSLMAEEERIAREIEEREIQELIQRTRGQAGGGGGGGGGAVGGFGFGYGDYGYGDYDFGDGGIAVTTEDESERAMLEDAIIQSLRER